MKKKSLTLKEVRATWWWRRKGIRRRVGWPLVEEAARNYELMRRSPKGKKFSDTYLELGRNGQNIVHRLWVNWKKHAFRPVTNPSQFKEIGWTPVVTEAQHRQWNLRVADSDLIDEFISEIRSLRKLQKIRVAHPNKGKKHRGVSWKLIEVLDRKQNGIGTLNDSERHTASDAQKRAKKYRIEYERALNKCLTSSDSFDPVMWPNQGWASF